MDRLAQQKVRDYFEAVALCWSEWISSGTHISFRPGQVIFYQGHVPNGVYILLSGDVVASRGESGREQTVANIPLKSLIGLDPLLAESEYPYSAIVQSEAELVFIPRDQMLAAAGVVV
jgi:CRP-like cAMP-binding protein